MARSGVALITITLQDSLYDTDPAWERVRQAMERVRLEFPDGVRQMDLDDRMTSNPAVVLAMASDPSVVSLSLAAERLKRQLADLPGLSRIEIEGNADEQITIAVKDAELNRLGISPGYLANVIGLRNQTSPGGFIVVDGKRISLLSNNEFEDLSSLRRTQIALRVVGLCHWRASPTSTAQPWSRNSRQPG